MNKTRLMSTVAAAATLAGAIGIAYAQSSDTTTAPINPGATQTTPATTTTDPSSTMTSPAMPSDNSSNSSTSPSTTNSASPSSNAPAPAADDSMTERAPKADRG